MRRALILGLVGTTPRIDCMAAPGWQPGTP